MLDYAAMLFKNQSVNFTLLHVKSPCKKASRCSGKCSILFSQKLTKDKSLLEAKGYDKEQIQSKFIEGPYIESIRNVVLEQQIDLIMLGNTYKKGNTKDLFFEKKTLEIITKVRCSIILIPEHAALKFPETTLFPTDFSITSDYSIFNVLTSLKFVNQTHLSLLPTGFKTQLGPNKKNSKALISKVINSLKFKSVKEIKSFSKAPPFQEFELIMVMAKNLSIFKDLFSTSASSVCPPETPILFLHDSRKF